MLAMLLSLLPAAGAAPDPPEPPRAELAHLNRFGGALLALEHGREHTCRRLERYIDYLEGLAWNQAGREAVYQQELTYARFCMRCWKALGDAAIADFPVEFRIYQLELLEMLLDPEDWAAGTMPPFPYGAFKMDIQPLSEGCP